MSQQPLMGQGLLIIEASQSFSDSPHMSDLLWKRDQPDAVTSTRQHTTLTTDRHPCHRWDSNPQSQQASGRRLTPWTARPLGPATASLDNLLNLFTNYPTMFRCMLWDIPQINETNRVKAFNWQTIQGSVKETLCLRCKGPNNYLLLS
jgi:hypothetical protein